MRAVDGAGTVDLGGGRRLDSHYAPGHAKHHIGLIDSVSGDLYVGDAAGIYIQETGDPDLLGRADLFFQARTHLGH
jgi:glyoxylase-like metal-dependent hydrolase (beta-lactamase superfamily II)